MTSSTAGHDRPKTPLPIVVELRARRRHLGLSQAQIAERLGVSPAAVTSWEMGTRMIPLDHAYDYAEAVGLEPYLREVSGSLTALLEAGATPNPDTKGNGCS